jgi:hypothetical protein
MPSGDCQVGGLVHFVASDVDALHDAFKKRQVPITEAPNDDLGFRNMTITDPDVCCQNETRVESIQR